jgi:hypothetical protein
MAIDGTSGCGGASRVGAGSCGEANGASAAALLPAPAGCGIDGMLADLYALISAQGTSDMKSGECRVTLKAAEHQNEIKDEMDALERQRKALGEGSKGFWGSIGGLFSDVGSDIAHARFADAVSDVKDDVSTMLQSPRFWSDIESNAGPFMKWGLRATVLMAELSLMSSGLAGESVAGTGGAAVFVGGLAATLSIAGCVVSETKCLGKSSDAIGGVMEGGGALVGALGLGQAGALGGDVHVATDAVLANARECVVLGGVTFGAYWSSHVMNAGFRAQADDAAADALDARHVQARVMREMDEILDTLKGAEASRRRAMETLNAAMTIDEQAQLTAAGRV